MLPPESSILSFDQKIKVPPHSIEAEQSVLGGLLTDPAAWDKVADILQAQDFYSLDHRLIYQQILHLVQAQKPVDVFTVAAALKHAGQVKETGGLDYLNMLAHHTLGSVNIHRYAEIVREQSLLRQLITVAYHIVSLAFNPKGKEVKQILDEAQGQILAISEINAKQQQGFLEIKPLMAQVMERIDELHHRTDACDITGVPTGFHSLDEMTSGLQNSDLIIIAGRPSMGKTALSLNIAEHVAIDQGLPVAVFSMEMSASQLATRLLGSLGRIDQHHLRTGRLPDAQWSRVTQAMQKINEAQLYIDETAALSPIELRARARRLAKTCGKLGLIIVDYLQLMTVHREKENRATEISEISRALKALAKELNCPVIALSQLNRSLEQRPNKRPIMSDLRESGAIEQDADLILFIYRDEVYNDQAEKGIAEILISKQRNGPVGDIRLKFIGSFTRFDNLPKLPHAAPIFTTDREAINCSSAF